MIDFDRVANACMIGGEWTASLPQNRLNACRYDDIIISHILFTYHTTNIIILADVLRTKSEIVNVLHEMLKM